MKIFLVVSILCLMTLAVMPHLALAEQCDTNTVASTTLCNGLGASSIQDFLEKTFTFVGTLVGLMAVTMIVYSGFRMIISRGDPDGLKTAKAGFSYAIVGVVISVMAFVIVLAVQNFIGVRGGVIDPSGDIIENPLVSNDLRGFMSNILTGFLGLVGALASVMIVYNGFLYLTSGGNEKQTEEAKSGLLWSIVGFGTVILAYVIVTALRGLLV